MPQVPLSTGDTTKSLKSLALLVLLGLLPLLSINPVGSQVVLDCGPGITCPTVQVQGTISAHGTVTISSGSEGIQISLSAQGDFYFNFVNESVVCLSATQCEPTPSPILGGILNGSASLQGVDSVTATRTGPGTSCEGQNSTSISAEVPSFTGLENSSGTFLTMFVSFTPSVNITEQCTAGPPYFTQSGSGWVILSAPIRIGQGFSSDLGRWTTIGGCGVDCQESWSVQFDFTSVIRHPGTIPASVTTSTQARTSSSPATSATSATPSTTETCTVGGSLGEALCPALPLGGVETLQGNVQVTNGLTGAPEDTSAVSIGSVIATGSGSVAGLKCVGGGPCDNQLEANSVAALMGEWQNPAGGVQVGPDESTSPTLGEWFGSVKQSADFASFFSDAVKEGYLTEESFTQYIAGQAGRYAKETVQGVVVDELSKGALHLAEKEANQVVNTALGIHNVEYSDFRSVAAVRGTEFTFSSETNGTTYQVYSGSLFVMSLATGQTAVINASQQLFIPGNTTQAGRQDLAKSVESFDPGSVPHWWVAGASGSPLGIPAYELGAIALAGVAVMVPVVFMLRRRPVKGVPLSGALPVASGGPKSRYCRHCGNSVSVQASFCNSCGEEI